MTDTKKTVYLMTDSVLMRRPGIGDLVRTQGVRYKAQWIAKGTGTVMYTSKTKDTRAQAEALARAWLAKNADRFEELPK